MILNYHILLFNFFFILLFISLNIIYIVKIFEINVIKEYSKDDNLKKEINIYKKYYGNIDAIHQHCFR